jgi:hypothetical protein
MRSFQPAVRRLATVLALAGCALAAAACGSSSSPSTTASSPGSGGGATTSAPPGSSGATLPSSCDQLKATVNPYVGGVGIVKPLLQKPNGVSCEFANSSATKLVIVNIGPGTPAAFAVLKSKSGGQGRTTATVSGLGSEAFSTSNGGRPGGVAVLTSQGDVFAVIAPLPFARDEALLRQLMSQF